MKTISEAVVLMAGAGSRLNGVGVQPAAFRSNGAGTPSSNSFKPLTPILQRPLVCYLFDALATAGIKILHAVVGYQSAELSARVKALVPRGLTVRFIENLHWQKQNGVSLLAAAGMVKSPFVLTMGDHVFEDAVLNVLMESAEPQHLNLAIDRKLDSIFDLPDAMKVQMRGDRIDAIGKSLQNYNAIDCGLFVCPGEIFGYLRQAQKNGDCALADGVELMAAEGKVRGVDIGNAWWQDVDTPEMLRWAEEQIQMTRRSLGTTDAALRAS
jgi:choline kinase